MAVQATFVLVSLCLWGFATANISSGIFDPSASVDESATAFATASGDSAAATSTMETGVVNVTPTTNTMASTPGGGGVVASQSATATAPLSTAGSGGRVSSVGGPIGSITPTVATLIPRVTPTIDFGVWTDNCKEICCKGLGQGKTYNKTRICAGSAVTHCKADNHGHNTTIAENCPIKCFDDECTDKSTGAIQHSIFLVTLLMSAFVFVLL